MRAAFLNRNPSTHPGGDLIMLHCLMRALDKRGIRCTNIYGEWTPGMLRLYDAVVIYHCNFTWSRENVEKTLDSKVPYALLPIFYPTDQLGMTFAEMRQMMQLAGTVCPLSFVEAHEIGRLTGFRGPFVVIPHGTEERFHHDNGGEREFVMAANVRGDKGEGAVERACRELNLPFRYVRGVAHHELHDVYRKARIFVHSSPDDRMSLTVGEALCSGCRVISSVHDRGNEWFPGMALADPLNELELTTVIARAWSPTDQQWDWAPNEQARRMTWADTALAWEAVLRRIA